MLADRGRRLAWGRAAAEHGFRRLTRGTTPEPVLTDGLRWAAYRASARSTRVIDDRTRASYTAPTPPKCSVAGFDALESDFDAQTAGSPTEEQGSYTLTFTNVGREWLGGMYDISRGVSHAPASSWTSPTSAVTA